MAIKTLQRSIEQAKQNIRRDEWNVDDYKKAITSLTSRMAREQSRIIRMKDAIRRLEDEEVHKR